MQQNNRESRLFQRKFGEVSIEEIAKQFYLTTDEWVEIEISPGEMKKNDAVDFAIRTLDEAGIKFYAKLTKDEKILIKRTDKNGEVIGNIQPINSNLHFKNNYKPV